ncbi:MAG TPA: TetR/AcrR family transcriptional regulator [Thermoanaerobaculia bacterium]|nr:TetR/AcrR family transcriptional regulator [Thermoanaerobaculia bacterium]
MIDGDSTQTSRSRLLAAGKHLFSRFGYEQTSTSAIARDAGTSESQLVRYFGGKSGLLEAIFNESWSSLNEDIRAHIGESEHGRDAIRRVVGLVIEAFNRDHEMAFLFLFEGRRVRGQEVTLSQGFRSFYDLIHQLIHRGQKDGSFRRDVNEAALASAMLGCAEGMIRERLIAERTGQANPFDDEMLQRVFSSMLDGLAPA